MLRYSQTGADVQLSVCLQSDVDEKDTETRPCLRNASNHETQQWDIFEFKSNSTYRFINVHNGTGYHMDCLPSGSVFMSPDIDDRPYQSAQHWLMTSASNVNDSAYSTVAAEVSIVLGVCPMMLLRFTNTFTELFLYIIQKLHIDHRSSIRIIRSQRIIIWRNSWYCRRRRTGCYRRCRNLGGLFYMEVQEEKECSNRFKDHHDEQWLVR